jgi:diguanylate cyclase (GGDEF)-like protein/PAS domain S-box-containing protein
MRIVQSYGAILNCMSEAVYVVDTDMKILYANPASETLTGYSIAEAIGDKCENIFCEASYRCAGTCPPKIVMTDQKFILHREAETKTKDGEMKDTQISFSPFYEGDRCVGAVVVIKDITEIRKAEKHINQQHKFLTLAIDALPDSFCVIDAQSYKIQMANKACSQGKVPEGLTCHAFTHNNVEPCQDAEHPCPLDVVKKTKQPYVVEHVHQGPGGESRNYEVHGYPILDDNGNVVQMIEYSVDITDRKKAEEMLRGLSATDGLTGIANRRAFDKFLEEELRHAVRSQYSMSVMMIDVDFFKRYNDAYGHLAGDECLKSIAAILKSISRRPGDIAARFGGEEFVLVLSMLNSEQAVTIAEKIRAEVEAFKMPHARSKISDFVTISIGVVSAIPNKDMTSFDFIKYADEALYKAKEEGRNRVVFKEVFPA